MQETILKNGRQYPSHPVYCILTRQVQCTLYSFFSLSDMLNTNSLLLLSFFFYTANNAHLLCPISPAKEQRYKRKPRFFVVMGIIPPLTPKLRWYKRFLFCLGCSSLPSTKYFSPPSKLGRQAAVLSRLSSSRCLWPRL